METIEHVAPSQREKIYQVERKLRRMTLNGEWSRSFIGFMFE
jgi:hypothetical protein